MLQDLLQPKHRLYKQDSQTTLRKYQTQSVHSNGSSPHIGSQVARVLYTLVCVRFPSSCQQSVSQADFNGHRGCWLSYLHGAKNIHHPRQLITTPFYVCFKFCIRTLLTNSPRTNCFVFDKYVQTQWTKLYQRCIVECRCHYDINGNQQIASCMLLWLVLKITFCGEWSVYAQMATYFVKWRPSVHSVRPLQTPLELPCLIFHCTPNGFQLGSKNNGPALQHVFCILATLLVVCNENHAFEYVTFKHST